MKYDELTEYISDMGFDDAVVFAPPMDYTAAVVGISEDGRVIYDHAKMVKSLVDDGMDEFEAEEFIEYNTIGALPSMGEKHR